MLITNWLAKRDSDGGFALKSELTNGDVRLYGNLYGHPDFADGEYVQTAHIVSVSEDRVEASCGTEFQLGNPAQHYKDFIDAYIQGITIIKNWSVVNGMLTGTDLNGNPVQGKVVSQNPKTNICVFKDETRVFVDWLSVNPAFKKNVTWDTCSVFGTEKCMLEIFGQHFRMFKENGSC